MQVNLSSGECNIISTGTAFLFGEDKDFTIEIAADNGFQFTLKMEFKEDEQSESRIDGDFEEDIICLQCFNFRDNGTGMCWPVQIGVLGGKKLYLMFWSYLNGEKGKRARSIQYTIFCEK
ncbi:MAG: hypothetical protein IKY94_06060 [Lachnospiraceae bacterium]|nr:hypothetical protein [Lachnospiraceae bacterium]